MIEMLKGLADGNDENILKLKNLVSTLQKHPGASKEEIDKINQQIKIMEKNQAKLRKKIAKIEKSPTGGKIIIKPKEQT